MSGITGQKKSIRDPKLTDHPFLYHKVRQPSRIRDFCKIFVSIRSFDESIELFESWAFAFYAAVFEGGPRIEAH